DLPWHGLRVRLELRVRRFFCDVPGCARRIFTERLPKTARPYARRTARAMTALDTIACALGGRAGARLAHALGLPIGASALVAHLRAPADSVARGSTAEAAVTTGVMPRVLGIGGWAWGR